MLTEWDEFRWVEVDKVADSVNAKAVVDARNLLDANSYRQAGFTYVGVGR